MVFCVLELFLTSTMWFCWLQRSSHVALIRCFQLAFSLRRISLDHEGKIYLLLWFHSFSYLFIHLKQYKLDTRANHDIILSGEV